eukprot:2787291-Rhodomonas_salina.1
MQVSGSRSERSVRMQRVRRRGAEGGLAGGCAGEQRVESVAWRCAGGWLLASMAYQSALKQIYVLRVSCLRVESELSTC